MSNLAKIRFPEAYFEPTYHLYVELSNFARDEDWIRQGLAAMGKPPTNDSSTTKEELKELLRKQNDPELAARKEGILAEANALPEGFNRLLLFDEKSHPRTHEMTRAMVTVGLVVGQYFKNKFMRARPSQLEPKLRPLIKVPGHPAYPSGHSLQGHWTAHFLAEIAPQAEKELMAIAWRFGENREWAGVHYASDTVAGKKLAKALYPQVRKAYSKTIQAALKEW